METRRCDSCGKQMEGNIGRLRLRIQAWFIWLSKWHYIDFCEECVKSLRELTKRRNINGMDNGKTERDRHHERAKERVHRLLSKFD